MPLKFAVLDSGTGGIPYMQYIKHVCSDSYCLYLADTLHFPYGTKTKEEVASCACDCVSLILSKWNPDAIVVACNTISVTALDILRTKFPAVPIVGTVPAIKLAASVSKKRNIGLLATEGTVRQPYINYLKDNFASDCKLVLRGDTELVDFVEHKFFNATEQECLAAVKPACDYFLSEGCDAIILGCTHFVHLRSVFEKYVKDKACIVDSQEGVARQTLKVASLAHERSLNSNKEKNDNLFSAIADFLDDHPLDQSLFVTGFPGENLSAQYEKLCRCLNIPWGGILKQ